ncbi:hypothetical protein ACGE0T_07365 [Parabacteroides sp. APC149_11_2_Y6]
MSWSYLKRMFINRVKELLLLRFYSFNKIEKAESTLYIVMIDGRFFHGGLSDRLKGIVSLYAYCKATKKNFRINFSSPFNLSQFLLSNEYDWTLRNNEFISTSFFSASPLIIINEYNGERLFKLKTKKQVHYYNNRDIVDKVNQVYNQHYVWGDLFKELFKPVPELEELISFHIKKIGGPYISIVFRFQQLLGDFEEYNFPVLDEEKKEILIDKCLRSIEDVKKTYSNYSILVTSDSISFLKRAKLLDVYILPGKIVHIDVTKGEQANVYGKSFLDMFMLSNSKMIFSIGTSDMYPSEFPLYASKINNIPFKRILLE